LKSFLDDKGVTAKETVKDDAEDMHQIALLKGLKKEEATK